MIAFLSWLITIAMFAALPVGIVCMIVLDRSLPRKGDRDYVDAKERANRQTW